VIATHIRADIATVMATETDEEKRDDFASLLHDDDVQTASLKTQKAYCAHHCHK